MARPVVAIGMGDVEMSPMDPPMRRPASGPDMNRMMVAQARAMVMTMVCVMMVTMGVVTPLLMITVMMMLVMMMANGGDGAGRAQRHRDEATDDGDHGLEGGGHVSWPVWGLARR